jgi:hypothetical protein
MALIFIMFCRGCKRYNCGTPKINWNSSFELHIRPKGEVPFFWMMTGTPTPSRRPCYLPNIS